MAQCQLCGQIFTNALQLGAHTRTHQAEDDNENFEQTENEDAYVITTPAPLCDLASRPPGSWDREENYEVQRLVAQHESSEILSRDYREVCMMILIDVLHAILHAVRFIVQFCQIYLCIYLKLQKLWKEFVLGAHGCCSQEFWQVFLSMRKTTQVVKDKVLKVVKKLLPQAKGHKWPSTCRVLRRRVSGGRLRCLSSTST